MDKTDIARDIVAYFRNNIEDYEERVSRALTTIDHWRCPLQMADRGLYYDMDEWLCVYCAEERDDIIPEDFDLDQLLFIE